MADEETRVPIDPRREQLHAELISVLGSSNVYFQPSGTTRMSYPCIKYSRDRGQHIYAGNKTYTYRQAYQLIYIDQNPDNDVVEKLIEHFPMINYNRSYIADNLNHDVLILYY